VAAWRSPWKLTNIIVLVFFVLFQVLGFTQAMTNPNPPPVLNKARTIGFAAFGAFALSLALGPSLGVGGHAPFLFGLGNLPTDWVQSLPFVSHTEPVNALSIPTWAIHFSSVFEYLFAMNLVWNYSKATGNETWKGLTWGMLPLHASGICACTVSEDGMQFGWGYLPTQKHCLLTLTKILTFFLLFPCHNMCLASIHSTISFTTHHSCNSW